MIQNSTIASKNQIILGYLLTIIIASVFFVNLLRLPYFGTKLQLTEIFFLLTAPFIPYKKVFEHIIKNYRTLLLLISIYAILDLISALVSHLPLSIMESLARVYLFSMFFVLVYYFSTFTLKNLLDYLTKIFIGCSIVIFSICLVSYTLLIFGFHNRFLYFAMKYPYFGDLYRFCGPTIYPVMMISMLNSLLFFFIGVYHTSEIKKKWLNLVIILLSVCLICTFSKSLVLTVLGLSIFYFKKKKILNRFSLALLICLFGGFTVLGTHFILVKKGTNELAILHQTTYTSDLIIFESNDYIVLETDYLTAKKASVNIFMEHPFFGVGTGNINKAIIDYRKRGLFPQKLGNLDPHSTYLGAFSENGLFAGIMLILILLYFLFQFIKRKDLFSSQLVLSLFVIYLFFLIDAIYTDMLNFRHMWLFLAIVVTCLAKSLSKNSMFSASV